MAEEVKSQAAVIKTLREQLADLQRSASIGAAITNSNQYNSISSVSPSNVSTGGNGDSLAEQVKAQAAEIDELNQQIAQSRALAAVGEARLNRWRSRIYN